jgi:pilus assembly protein FimV
MKNFALIIALSTLLFSSQVSSLGMGEVEVESPLGRPFSAKIPLSGIDRISMEGLLIKARHQRANLSGGPSFLSSDDQLQYRIEGVNPGQNRAVIHVFTRTPVKEPILQFILELEWRSGKLTREFFAFLEPAESKQPETRKKIAQPSVTPAEALVAEKAALEPEIVLPVNKTIDSTQTPAKALASGQVTVAEKYYGPTVSGNSLWRVARQVRGGSKSASMHQWMFGIWKQNKSAFINGNMHRLAMEQMLRIPSAELVSGVDFREASGVYSDHLKLLDQKAPKAEVEPIDEKEIITPLESIGLESEMSSVSTETSTQEGGEPMRGSSVVTEIPDPEVIAEIETQYTVEESTLTVEPTIESDGVNQAELSKPSEDQNALTESLSQPLQGIDVEPASTDWQSMVITEAGLLLDQLNDKVSALLAASSINESAPITENTTGGQQTDDALVKFLKTITRDSTLINIMASAMVLLLLAVLVGLRSSRQKNRRAPTVAARFATVPASSRKATVIQSSARLKESQQSQIDQVKRSFNMSEAKEKQQTAEDIIDNSAQNPLPEQATAVTANEDDELNLDLAISDLAEEDELEHTQYEAADSAEDYGVDILSEVDIFIAYQDWENAVQLLEESILEHPDNAQFKFSLLRVFFVASMNEAFRGQVSNVRDVFSELAVSHQMEAEKMLSDKCPDLDPFNSSQSQGADAAGEPERDEIIIDSNSLTEQSLDQIQQEIAEMESRLDRTANIEKEDFTDIDEIAEQNFPEIDTTTQITQKLNTVADELDFEPTQELDLNSVEDEYPLTQEVTALIDTVDGENDFEDIEATEVIALEDEALQPVEENTEVIDEATEALEQAMLDDNLPRVDDSAEEEIEFIDEPLIGKTEQLSSAKLVTFTLNKTSREKERYQREAFEQEVMTTLQAIRDQMQQMNERLFIQERESRELKQSFDELNKLVGDDKRRA